MNIFKAGVLAVVLGYTVTGHGQGADFVTIAGITNGEVTVTWTNNAVLQISSNLNAWSDLRAANPPYTQDADSQIEFFRLRLPDFTLFENLNTRLETSLIDYDKNLIHTWTNDRAAGSSVYLLGDGRIVRAVSLANQTFNEGGSGGRIEERDWDSSPLWSFDYSTTTNCQHHDLALLPDGNILFVAWDSLTRDEAIALGRNPALIQTNDNAAIWPDTVVEIQPTGTVGGIIVWKWSVMDHVIQDFDPVKPNYGVIADHPELVNFNYPSSDTADWMHVNAIDYNAALDQIVISVHHFGEIWIIDHSTTPAEAASHSGGNSGRGGDLLYRWGNPQAYDAGNPSDQILGGQHNPTWIPVGYPGAGNLLVFNNGIHRGFSSVDEITPPLLGDGTYEKLPGEPYGPTNLTWSYVADPPSSFYATFVSGAQRLMDGNTLICHGPFRKFFEVDPSGATVWSYDVPGSGFIFRATRVYFDLPE